MNKPTVKTDNNGNLILEDKEALGVIKAVSKHNCKSTLELNKDRVEYFQQRFVDAGYSPEEIVIVVIHVDDSNGRILADALMPGHNWQEYRDRGEKPFARGLADRAYVQDFLDIVDREAGKKLWELYGIGVVVVDYEVAEVFSGTEV